MCSDRCDSAAKTFVAECNESIKVFSSGQTPNATDSALEELAEILEDVFLLALHRGKQSEWKTLVRECEGVWAEEEAQESHQWLTLGGVSPAFVAQAAGDDGEAQPR
ncbi:hypothetical protein Q8A73_001103 [Channa argus]|nr:hypothetical protein Q8A73_001103 [Channa argus]